MPGDGECQQVLISTGKNEPNAQVPIANQTFPGLKSPQTTIIEKNLSWVFKGAVNPNNYIPLTLKPFSSDIFSVHLVNFSRC